MRWRLLLESLLKTANFIRLFWEREKFLHDRASLSHTKDARQLVLYRRQYTSMFVVSRVSSLLQLLSCMNLEDLVSSAQVSQYKKYGVI